MQSSNMEDVLKLKRTSEDAKTLSPLTYYQPFQSTFDPEFGVPKPSPRPASLRIPVPGIWAPGLDKHAGPGRAVVGGLPKEPGFFGSEFGRPGTWSACQPKPSWTSRSTRSPEAESALRNVVSGRTAAPWPGLRFASPSDRKGFGTDGGHGVGFPAGATHGSGVVGSGLGVNRAGSSYGHFGTSSFGLGPLSAQSTGYQSPARDYYPLALSSFAKTAPKTSYNSGHSKPMVCNFCKNNKEVPDIYLNHYLYDPETKVLTCPVLRKHVCEICGGTGDHAHTLQYCPVNRERGLQAKIPVLLKARTITNSTGKIRRN